LLHLQATCSSNDVQGVRCLSFLLCVAHVTKEGTSEHNEDKVLHVLQSESMS
jgi:hypothetical protein